MTRRAPRSGSRGRSLSRAVATGVGAAALYGTWALVANRGHGLPAALRAAAVQAALSFVATISMVLVVEALFRAGGTPARGFWLAAVGATVLTVATMSGAHWVAGTAAIAATIAPSVLIGSGFFTAYAWRLRVLARRQADGERVTSAA